MELKDIKIGMKVRVRKPEDVRERPIWTPGMDRFDGQVVEVAGMLFGAFSAEGWAFSPAWAEPVGEMPVDPEIAPGDWVVPECGGCRYETCDCAREAGGRPWQVRKNTGVDAILDTRGGYGVICTCPLAQLRKAEEPRKEEPVEAKDEKITVVVNNEEESSAVQEEMFRRGWRWRTKGAHQFSIPAKYPLEICMGWVGSKLMTWAECGSHSGVPTVSAAEFLGLEEPKYPHLQYCWRWTPENTTRLSDPAPEITATAEEGEEVDPMEDFRAAYRRDPRIEA